MPYRRLADNAVSGLWGIAGTGTDRDTDVGAGHGYSTRYGYSHSAYQSAANSHALAYRYTHPHTDTGRAVDQHTHAIRAATAARGFADARFEIARRYAES